MTLSAPRIVTLVGGCARCRLADHPPRAASPTAHPDVGWLPHVSPVDASVNYWELPAKLRGVHLPLADTRTSFPRDQWFN